MQIVTPVTDYIPRSILTADGDYAFRDGGVPARIGLGTGVNAQKSGNQSILASTWTEVIGYTATVDVLTEFDTVNGRFAPTETGLYLISVQATLVSFTAGKYIDIEMRVDGTNVWRTKRHFQQTSGYGCIDISSIFHLLSGWYLSMWIYHNDTVARNCKGDATGWTYFTVCRAPSNWP